MKRALFSVNRVTGYRVLTPECLQNTPFSELVLGFGVWRFNLRMRKFHVAAAERSRTRGHMNVVILWPRGASWKSAKMSTKIPWSTAISNGGTGSYTGVPSASYMCKQSMKKPRKKIRSASNSSSNSEGSIENGHQEDKIPAAALR